MTILQSLTLFNTFLFQIDVIFWRVIRHIGRKKSKKHTIMKKTTLAITLMVAAMMNGCSDWDNGDRDYPDNPRLTDVVTSDCHSFTDIIAAKDMNTDSVVVTYIPYNYSMSVIHYNMPLDCGSGEHIVTSIERRGDTITVTEDVGEQGRTNCVCLYDNSFQIIDLPLRPFTLIVKVVSGTGQTTVYQQTFE